VPLFGCASSVGGPSGRDTAALHERLKSDVVAAPQGGVAGLELGATQNRLAGYLTNNAALRDMAGLLRDPRMDQIVPALKERLRAEGVSLTGARDGMLPDARGLDAEDTDLAARRDRLNETKRKLDERLADINRQAADHERACLPTHPEERHSWCVESARRLNAIIDPYNADVRSHAAAVEKVKSDITSLTTRWDTFVQRISAWEGKVKALIETIQKAFQELKDCVYQSGSSELIRLDPIESKITCRYDCCGRPSETYQFISGRPTQEQIDFVCTHPLPRCLAPPAAGTR